MTAAAEPEDFGTLLDAQTLRFERDLPGPIERVWAYITEPDRMATWIAAIVIPHEVGATFEHRWSADADDDEPGGMLRGRVRAFDPPHVLEYSWTETNAPQGGAKDSIVRYELKAAGDRVLLTLTHSAMPLRAYSSFGAGWHAHLDTLRAQLSGVRGPDSEERYDMLVPQYGDMADFPDASTVRLGREVPGPLNRVWAFLTERAGLAQWLAVGAIPTDAGATFTLTLLQDDVAVSSTLLAYEHQRAMEYTWSTPFDPKDAPVSIVRFEVAATEDEILLTITHRGVLPEFAARVASGWHALADALNAVLHEEEPPEFFDVFERIIHGYDGVIAGDAVR